VADETLRFDIIGNDRASGAFSRVGREAEGMGAKMDYAHRQAAALDRSLDRMNHKTINVSVDVNRTLKTTDRTLSDVQRLLSGGGGGGAGGIGAAASAGTFGLPAAAGLVNPYTIAGALAASPFLGAGIGGAVLGVLGGGLTGLGVLGAFGPGASATRQQIQVAQLRLAAAQASFSKLQASGKATAAQLASSHAAVLTAQGNLATLQNNAPTAGQQAVRDAFKNLSNDAQDSLSKIGTSFVPVMHSIFTTADSVMKKLTPVFSNAVAQISGPFQILATTVIKTFARADVVSAIENISTAFTKFLVAFTPQIPGIADAIAKGVTGLAQAFSDHPGMIAAMSSILAFLLRLPGYALAALGSLARVADWLVTGFPHQVSRGLDAARKFFENFVTDVHRWWDDVLRDTRITWNDVYGATIGALIRMGHDIERIFNQVVAWFKALPGRILGAVTGLGADLWGFGKKIISDFWTGIKTVWHDVIGWFASLPGRILSAIGINSPPRWAVEAGEHILQGLFGWTGTKKHQILNRFSHLGQEVGAAVSATAAGLGSGVAAEQRYAAQMLTSYGWGQDQLGPLIALWNRESGWNPWAVNPSSGAAGIPQNIQGWAAYSPGDWANQIRWGLTYIFGRYGSPGAAWAHEMAFGWYDRGGYLPPGLSLAYNTTGRPEPVGMTGGNTYNITVNVPPTVNPREAGRQVADLILAHTKAGGRLYPQGTAPR
jgi:hypothetical protein